MPEVSGVYQTISEFTCMHDADESGWDLIASVGIP